MGGKDCACASKESTKDKESCKCEKTTPTPKPAPNNKPNWVALDSLSSTDYKALLNSNSQMAALVAYFEKNGGKAFYSGNISDTSNQCKINFQFTGAFSEEVMNSMPIKLDWRNACVYGNIGLEMSYTNEKGQTIPLLAKVNTFSSRIFSNSLNSALKKESKKYANSDKSKPTFLSTLQDLTGKNIGSVVDNTTTAIGIPEYLSTGTTGFAKTTTSVTMGVGSTSSGCNNFCNNFCGNNDGVKSSAFESSGRCKICLCMCNNDKISGYLASCPSF